MDEKNPAAEAPEKKPGKKKLIMIVGAVLVIAGGAGGAWFMTQSHAPAAHGKPTPKPVVVQYIPLEPAFVVNLADDTEGRFLQLEIQLMSKDPTAADMMERHAPLIRNRLLLLFGQKKYEELLNREGKEKLQAEALAEIRKIFMAEAGRGVIDAVYFTSFVMQ